MSTFRAESGMERVIRRQGARWEECFWLLVLDLLKNKIPWSFPTEYHGEIIDSGNLQRRNFLGDKALRFGSLKRKDYWGSHLNKYLKKWIVLPKCFPTFPKILFVSTFTWNSWKSLKLIKLYFWLIPDSPTHFHELLRGIQNRRMITFDKNL